MNPNDYTPRQAQRDQEYREAWDSDEVQQWIASLPPKERSRLEKEGVLKPMLQKHGSGRPEGDLADSSLASEEPDYIAQIEPETPTHEVPRESDDERLMDMLRRLLAEVLSQKNSRLTLECLAVACGLNLVNGDSMTEIGKRHGISRAAVSKRCVDITEKLNLPPSRAMRSKKARQIYRKVQLELRKLHERTGNR